METDEKPEINGNDTKEESGMKSSSPPPLTKQPQPSTGIRVPQVPQNNR